MKKHTMKMIWLMFTVFSMLFIFSFFLLPSNTLISGTTWLLLNIWALVMGISLIIQNGLPASRYIVISLLLSILSSLGYLIHSLPRSLNCLFITFVTLLAIFTTFDKFPKEKFQFIITKKQTSLLISICLGLLCGGLLSYISYQFIATIKTPDFNFSVKHVLFAASVAFSEILILQSLFYTFCINLISGKITKTSQQFTYWFMMIVPFTIAYTFTNSFASTISLNFINFIISLVLFAFPLAFLQKHRDITSAVIAYGVINTIHYCFFGLPF
ncbi:MAG: hypothetical protein ACRCSG_02000 [Cellulosilyticaceae bacterium]